MPIERDGHRRDPDRLHRLHRGAHDQEVLLVAREVNRPDLVRPARAGVARQVGGEAVPLCREGPQWVVRQEAHGILVLEADVREQLHGP